jgi:hypothetical protein
MVTLAAAPVAAWVGLWPEQKSTPPEIGFDLPEVIDVDESDPALQGVEGNQVIGPVDEFDTFEWSEESTLALQQSNYRVRLEYAGASLKAADAAAVARGDKPSELFPVMVVNSHGIEERGTFSSLTSWSGLWQEFGSRCRINESLDLSAAVLSRCKEALDTPVSADAGPEEFAARAAWSWVLYGDVAAAGSVELAWENAPFVASN